MGRKILLFVLVLYVLPVVSIVSKTTQSVGNLSSPVPFETIHNLNTNKNYTTIQAAISDAETVDGHTIFVEEGIYRERVVVDKSLLLTGENRDTTIIDGNGIGTVVCLTAQNVSVSNLTIMNAGFQPPISGAIFLNETANCEIENVVVLDNDPCGITLFNSTNNKVSRSEFFNSSWALLLVNSHENMIVGNVISRNSYGIGLGGPEGSSSNLLAHNRISDNAYHGIDVFGFDNRVSSNRLLNNGNGVLLDRANGNVVIGNNISSNSGVGVYVMRGSESNTIVGNIVQFNLLGVVIRDHSRNNLVFRNNFINNQAIVQTLYRYANIWDNGIEGNHWSTYTGVDLDYDGIGDAEHIIGVGNIDHFPLMGMFFSFNTSLGCHVNVISDSTMEDFEYFESNNTIKMHVSNTTTTQTSGFCRICIPHALMSVSNISVVIDNGLTPALHKDYTLYDNGTHRWIYFAYEHPTHKIDIIPEFPSFLIPPSFMIATLLAAIVCRRKHSM